MTYIVSSGALNSTHSLTRQNKYNSIEYFIFKLIDYANIMRWVNCLYSSDSVTSCEQNATYSI